MPWFCTLTEFYFFDWWRLVCEDITGGQENFPIPATNLVDDPPVAPTGNMNFRNLVPYWHLRLLCVKEFVYEKKELTFCLSPYLVCPSFTPTVPNNPFKGALELYRRSKHYVRNCLSVYCIHPPKTLWDKADLKCIQN